MRRNNLHHFPYYEDISNIQYLSERLRGTFNPMFNDQFEISDGEFILNALKSNNSTHLSTSGIWIPLDNGDKTFNYTLDLGPYQIIIDEYQSNTVTDTHPWNCFTSSIAIFKDGSRLVSTEDNDIKIHMVSLIEDRIKRLARVNGLGSGIY